MTTKKWIAEHKEQRKSIELKSKHGITYDDYARMMVEQEGKCAICGNLVEPMKFKVDHDHVTGKVRGLLCHKCNIMLGLADDSMQKLENAILYLKKSTSPLP